MAASPVVKVIYGKPMLPDVARVLACLHEKEIKFHLADMNNGDQIPPDIINLQISSHGHTPGLQDDMVELFGSRKICRHIVENYGAYGYQYLLGKDPLARVTVEQWIQSEEQNFDPPSSALVFYLAYKIESDEEPIAQSEKKLVKVLNLYEKRLDECEFLGGNYFTLADLYHLPNSHYLDSSKEFGHLFKDRKNVSRWWKSISSRDSWKKVVEILDREGLLAKAAVANNEAKKPSFPSKSFPGKNGDKNKFTEQTDGKTEGTKEEHEEKDTPPPSEKKSSPDHEKKENNGEPKPEVEKDGKDEHSTQSNKEFNHSKGEKKYEATDTMSESRKEAAGSKAKDSTPPGNNKSSDQNKVEKGTEGSGPDTGDKKDTGEKRDGPTSDGKKKETEAEHEEKATPPQSKKKSSPDEEKKEHDGEPKPEVKKDGKDEYSTTNNKELDHSMGDKTYEATDKMSESRKGATGSKAKDSTPPGSNKISDQNKVGKGTEGSGLDSGDKKDTGEKKDGPTSDVKDKASSSNNKGSDKNMNREAYTREENKKVEENKPEREVSKGSEKADANNKGPAPDKKGRSKADNEGKNEKTKSDEKEQTPNTAADGKKDSAATSETDKFPSGANKNPDPSIEKGGESN